ncbi:MAG: DUF3168 domain-containing protein [Rubrivivax sp.]|nr:MAG: DUF3168 domain-containing protein [Rubrivivax sp.]
MSSIEVDLRAALLASPTLVALVSGRVCIDEVPEDAPRPYIVFAKQSGNVDRGLDGKVHHETARIDIQCVGESRSQGIQLADLVREALEAVDQPPDDFAAGYDPENDIEAEVVSVDWWR